MATLQASTPIVRRSINGHSSDRKAVVPEFEVHELLKGFPPLEGEAFDVFCEGIDAHGQSQAIYMFRDERNKMQLISGLDTLRACQRLQIEPKITIWTPDGSLAAFVAKENFVRGHLEKGQRAALGVFFEDQLVLEARRRSLGNLRRGQFSEPAKLPDREERVENADSREKAGRLVGVSGRYISEARVVRNHSPAVFESLRCGTLTLQGAKREIARDVKRDVLTKGPAPVEGGANWRVICGDSLIQLPEFPRHKFRLILADPPYNEGIDYGDGSKADNLPVEKFRAWAGEWIAECAELLTADGSMWVCINDEHAADFVLALRGAGLTMRSWVKWYETFGNNCTNKFNRTSRHLLYFTKSSSRFVFNASVFNRPSARQTVYNDKRAVAGGKIWDDVWQIPRLVDNARERVPGFPTQLPLELIRPIVEGCSEAGDEVLDPFNGSGTTGEACILCGRNYTGIEKSKTFADLSRHRLAAVAKDVKARN